jgi:hypothetical protein
MYSENPVDEVFLPTSWPAWAVLTDSALFRCASVLDLLFRRFPFSWPAWATTSIDRSGADSIDRSGADSIDRSGADSIDGSGAG